MDSMANHDGCDFYYWLEGCFSEDCRHVGYRFICPGFGESVGTYHGDSCDNDSVCIFGNSYWDSSRNFRC